MGQWLIIPFIFRAKKSCLQANAEYFGFTQDEVDGMLANYGIPDKTDEMKEWYNGYLCGNTEIYNPWSAINYIYDIVYNNTKFPKPYWANTSSNSIVQELVVKADDNTRRELERHLLPASAYTLSMPVSIKVSCNCSPLPIAIDCHT